VIAVVDTSAAVEIVLKRQSAGKLIQLIKDADWILALHLFKSETVNVFWKYHAFAGLPIKECEIFMEQTLAISDDFIDEMDIYREEFKLNCDLTHTVYAMLYLIIARRHNGTLLTQDKKLSVNLELRQGCHL